jgi:hypothetical protein
MPLNDLFDDIDHQMAAYGCCSQLKAVERNNHKAVMTVTACCPLNGKTLIPLWEK